MSKRKSAIAKEIHDQIMSAVVADDHEEYDETRDLERINEMLQAEEEKDGTLYYVLWDDLGKCSHCLTFEEYLHDQIFGFEDLSKYRPLRLKDSEKEALNQVTHLYNQLSDLMMYVLDDPLTYEEKKATLLEDIMSRTIPEKTCHPHHYTPVSSILEILS